MVKNIPNQPKTAQEQLPSWHGCPVVNSKYNPPIIPIRNGKKPNRVMQIKKSICFLYFTKKDPTVAFIF